MPTDLIAAFRLAAQVTEAKRRTIHPSREYRKKLAGKLRMYRHAEYVLHKCQMMNTNPAEITIGDLRK